MWHKLQYEPDVDRSAICEEGSQNALYASNINWKIQILFKTSLEMLKKRRKKQIHGIRSSTSGSRCRKSGETSDM
ncbi:hypothetical protein L3Y34_011451 [Caenorhabditis briggsae]|uniref:Uncharacterized protein n=1 Tax=Caenorhabditis briggsae TaxID=6238 RepID=A0AAE9CV27_CAEBR|nr:hypothetical protein L3Y34_011451 [Caenorhabditis briggsae]